MANLRSAFGGNSFNPDDVPDFEPIPAGKYRIQFTTSEMVATKNGNGEYLSMVAEVMDGEFKGRKLFERLNLVNQNEKAVEIAQRTLGSICRAALPGTKSVDDSEKLHFKPMMANVVVIPPTPDKMDPTKVYPAKNEIKGYEATANKAASAASSAGSSNTSAKSSAQAADPAPAPAAAKVSAGSRPWQKTK